MIQNEKQYKISKFQLQNLQKALDVSGRTENKNVHPQLLKAQQEAFQSQYNEILKEVNAYELLKEAGLKKIEIESFESLPEGLIKARIARGLSQKELAEKMGLKEQQIQRYEATNYSTASFDRLKSIVKALEVNVREDIFLSNASFNETLFFKKLSQIGITKDFILSRLLPFSISEKIKFINDLTENEAHNLLQSTASIISKIFRINIETLFTTTPLILSTNSLSPVRYKKATNANKDKISAYTFYAHFLALTLYQSKKSKIQLKVPEDPELARTQIVKKYGKINFEHVVRYIWSLGIPVIALNEQGAFHGACWRIDGFNIIALKQKTMSEARWIHDALHELFHAGQHPNQPTLEIIESEDISSEDLKNEDEIDANYYAADVVLGIDADVMAEECIKVAGGNLVRLKGAAETVSKKYGVDVGSLANYLAFRLAKEQDVSWWGAANNLQKVGFSPWEICKELIWENCDLDTLNDFERELLIKALV